MKVALFPFLVFFLLMFFFWLAFQVMHPRQPNAPKVPTYKIVLIVTTLVASVSVGVVLLLYLVAPTAFGAPAEVPKVQPRALAAPPAPKVDAPLPLPKRVEREK